MEAKAIAKTVRISALKSRLVMRLINGKDVSEAMAILNNMNNKAARVIKKVLTSAVANAENNHNLDKAKLYVLNNGAISWGDGGELHDVVNMYKKYGAVPQEVYTGLKSGQTLNNFKEMQDKLKPVLDSLVAASGKGKLSDNWMSSEEASHITRMEALEEEREWERRQKDLDDYYSSYRG